MRSIAKAAMNVINDATRTRPESFGPGLQLLAIIHITKMIIMPKIDIRQIPFVLAVGCVVVGQVTTGSGGGIITSVLVGDGKGWGGKVIICLIRSMISITT